MEFSLNKLKSIDLDKFVERVREVNSPEPDKSEGLVAAGMDLETIRPRFDEYMAKVTQLEGQAEALVLKTDADREVAANLAVAAKKMVKAVNDRKLEITAAARKFVDSVNGLADKFIDRFKSTAKIAGDKELAYVKLQEMKRREQEKLAQEAAAKLQKEIDKEAKKKGIEPIKIETPVVPETKTTARTEAGVTSYIAKNWVCNVFDWTRVPQKYWSKKCSHVQENLDEAVKNGVRGIPGCFIHEKTGIRHRG